MRFYVIASSSKGNVSYLEVGKKKILIDAGISYTRIKNALRKIDVNIKELTDVFITHEHNDHVSGLKVLLKYTNPQVHLSEGTNERLNIKGANIIKEFKELVFDCLTVTPLPLSHDANEPLGFLFENNVSKIAYITDTGYIEKRVRNKLKDSTLFYLESNHDPYMLTNSKRPYYLINRILNEKGHLSNYDSAYYFANMIGKNTTHLIYAHISQECNTTELIENTYKDVLTAQGVDFSNVKFIEAHPSEPLEVIIL